jgi:hypothetical protein
VEVRVGGCVGSVTNELARKLPGRELLKN